MFVGGPIRGNGQSATILVLTHTTQDCDNKIGQKLNGGYNDDDGEDDDDYDEGDDGNIDDDALHMKSARMNW